MKRTKLGLGILGLIAMTVFAQDVLAAVCTSRGNGNWGDRFIWSCGHIPGNADTAVIANGFTVTLNRNYTVGSLSIDAGGTLNDNGNNLTVNGSITVNGAFGIQNSGNQGVLISAGNNAVISGNGTFYDTTLQLNAAATIAAGSNLSFDGLALIDTNGRNLTIAGTVTGTNSANGAGNGGASGTTIIDVYGASTVTIAATGTVNATGAMIMLNNSTSAVINNGTATLAAIESVPGGTWTQAANSALTMAQNTGNWAGNLNASAAGNTVTYGAGVAPIVPVSNTYYNLFGPTCAQVAGLTILGTGPSCAPPVPMAYYHMDEASWNGTASQVVDSSGNGYNAQSFNNASTDGITPAIAGSPGTCRYGVFDNATTITQGYVQTPLPNLTTNFTVTAWIRTTNNSVTGQRILIDDLNNTGGYGISLGDGGTGIIRFYSRAINPVIFDSSYPIANNTWYFVAAVADITNRKRSIYVFSQAGTLLNASIEGAAYSGTWGTDAGPVSIGGEVNQTLEPPASFHFHGNLDEVQVFQAALTQPQLAQIAAQTHPCLSAVPDHLMIQSSGSGLTCAASTLTIVACQDPACTVPYTGGVTGTLIASGPPPTVNWDGTTGGATGSGFVIAAGTSLVTKNVQVATAGSVVFGISSAGPTPFNPTVCNFGTPVCTFTANTAGFIFSDTSSPGNVYAIPPQVSGIPTPTLYLRAVQASTTSPAVCTPAIISSTAAVNMGYSCNNPAACQPGNLATINATAIAPAGTPVSLGFDANGSAPVTVRYDDVGQITLNANATVTPFGGATPVPLSGSSNAYTVAPHHFGFSAVTVAPIKASSPFSATITAYNGLATPTATANFGLETPAQGVTLTQSLVQPTGTGASAGALGATTFTPYSVGATTATTSWSEVGLITLTATNSNYLGSGLAASGTSANVGAFIPDHYTTVVTQACSAGGFSYSGQPFAVQVNSLNGAGGITQNYDGTANTAPNFANTVALSDASGSPAGTLAPAAVPASTFSAGTANAATAYIFASRTTVPTAISLRATYTNATPAYTVSSSGFSEGSATIYSGRARFSNAHGSENLALPVPFTTEYWLNGWVTNTTDYCTGDITLGAANALSVSLSASPATCVQDNGNPGLSGAGCATAGPVAQRFSKGATPSIGFAGNFNLWLRAPGGSSSGAVTVTGNVPVWLQYPWLGGAAINPSALATFGVYKGPNQFIYQREDY